MEILEFEKGYFVDTLGNVFSSKRENMKELIPAKNKKGFMCLCLYLNGGPTSDYVHRVVANAFIPNEDKHNSVMHLNGDKEDNRSSNLKGCSRSESLYQSITYSGRVWNGNVRNNN